MFSILSSFGTPYRNRWS